MPTLFILSHAPSADPSQASTLQVARPGDSVLLIEDAVYASSAVPTPLSTALWSARERGVSLLALAPDAAARGVQSSFPTVDYDGFVGLVETHDRSVH